jgi:hypothetical protein
MYLICFAAATDRGHANNMPSAQYRDRHQRVMARIEEAGEPAAAKRLTSNAEIISEEERRQLQLDWFGTRHHKHGVINRERRPSGDSPTKQSSAWPTLVNKATLPAHPRLSAHSSSTLPPNLTSITTHNIGQTRIDTILPNNFSSSLPSQVQQRRATSSLSSVDTSGDTLATPTELALINQVSHIALNANNNTIDVGAINLTHSIAGSETPVSDIN